MPLAFDKIRGTGYIPATTQMRDAVQGLLSPRPLELTSPLRYPSDPLGRTVPFGQFHQDFVRQELQWIHEFGFNAIRLYIPFAAWFLDRGDFLTNLTFLRNECQRRGLYMLPKLWSHNWGPPYLQVIETLRLAPTRGAPHNDPRITIQMATDASHMGGQLAPPRCPAGTWFQFGGMQDLDWAMVKAAYRKGVDKPPPVFWDSFHKATPMMSPRTNKPEPLSAVMTHYMLDVAGVFHQSPAFLAYDVYNEPDAFANDDLVIDFTAYSVRTLEDEHKRLGVSGSWQPEFTMGLGSPTNIVKYYGDLLFHHKTAMSFVSFHRWDPDLQNSTEPSKWDLAARSLPTRRPHAAMEVVCTEFYGQGKYPRNQNRLREILTVLKDLNWGGFVWNFLESNVFQNLDTKGAPAQWKDPIDGFLIPHDVAAGVHARNSSSMNYTTNPQVASGKFDVYALTQWVLGRL